MRKAQIHIKNIKKRQNDTEFGGEGMSSLNCGDLYRPRGGGGVKISLTLSNSRLMYSSLSRYGHGGRL